MAVYLDTSALLKLYVDEKGRDIVAEVTATTAFIATSVVAYAEARAGLARRYREGDFTHSELRKAVSDINRDWGSYILIRATDRIVNHAGQIAERHALRGFDAIHLASALHLAERFEGLSFLAFDHRLNNAARDAGLSMPLVSN